MNARTAEPRAPVHAVGDNMRSALLASTFGSRIIGDTFKRMDIAEQEIARAMKAHPIKAVLLHKTFKFLAPSKWLHDCHPRVYRAHCRELLERRLKSAKPVILNAPTRAEACMMISEFSLEAKPTRRLQALFTALFLQIFPEKAAEIPPVEEEWKGANAEILAGIRKKHPIQRNV